jgi:hypothetical protein
VSRAELVERVSRLLHREGLPAPARVIPLDGEAPLAGGADVAPALAQNDHGVFFVIARSVDDGVVYPLGRNPTLRYEQRLFGDRLTVDGRTYGVPLRESGEVRRALALGRLAMGAPHDRRPPDLDGRFLQLEAEDPLTRWLTGALQPEEPLLAVMETGDEQAVESTISAPAKAPVRFVLTNTRALLVAIGPVGDVWQVTLPNEPMSHHAALARADRLSVGGHQLSVTSATAKRYDELAPLTGLPPDERTIEIARLNLAAHPAAAIRLLTTLEGRGDALHRLLAALARGETHPSLTLAVRRTGLGAEAFALLLDRWAIPVDRLLRLIAGAVEAEPAEAEWLLPTHRLAWRLRVEQDTSPGAQARADIELTEHLLLAGQHESARALITTSLQRLPDEALIDLLPPDDADLTTGEAGQRHRVRLLELLALAEADDPARALATLIQLARLQPLVPQRLDELLQLPDAPIAERARAARSALERFTHAVAPPSPPLHGMPDALIQSTVQHPLARQGGALGWLQGWLAKQAAPDQAALRKYCERPSPKRHGALIEALADVAMALGMPGLEIYLSHGELGEGVHAFEAAQPFVLMGGQHLNEESEVFLSPAELRFALGAELAHLRFKHTRVTSGEVWDGAFDKLRTALSTTASALTLGGAGVGKLLGDPRVLKATSSMFSVETLKRIDPLSKNAVVISQIVTDASRWLSPTVSPAITAEPGTLSIGRGGSVSVRRSELVAAHRVMQLTADRAGLIVCGDLHAALRAMLLTDPEIKSELSIVERHGIGRALSRRGPGGVVLHQDLAVRVAALVSFWLSDEYAQARGAVAPTPG